MSAGGSGIECLHRVGTVELGFWQNTLTASASVRITRLETVGHGVRVLGGLLVPVVGGSVHSSGVSDWPPVVDRVLRKDVDWARRVSLIGGELPVQRAMLPVLHLRAVGDGRLDAVVFHFVGDDGQTGTARLALGFRFSRNRC